jgi:ppGpp synthetase/RelA/SpoT-type nucleotidyltranferase
MTVDIEKLKDALEKAQDLIAANRLVLGEYSGVREVHQIESRIKEAISIVAKIEKSESA